ncbi:MAG: putative peptidoglycan glycosyltransferase FtsW [Patescibacteria group bacterium]
MARAQSFDRIFFVITIILLSVGLFILGSASMGISARQFGQSYYYFLHQILFGVLPGLFLLWITLRIPYDRWKKYALPLLVISIILTSLVFAPRIGMSHGGAKRWLYFGIFSFQPSEFLKFAFIVYLSVWLEARHKDLHSFTTGLLPFLIMSGFIALFLIFQPDIGTLGVLMVSASVLFAVSGGTVRHFLLLGLLGVAILGILIKTEPYRLDRFKTFYNPSAVDSQGIGYQSRQALIAIGSGGLWGRGYALSRQKFSYLPEPIGDSIFAIAVEELGFIGGITIIFLYILFYLRGISIIRSTSDIFGKLLGTGLLLLIIFQAFINISAISGLGPLTGIPLSLISYGGTALAIMLAEIGIILNISKSRQ